MLKNKKIVKLKIIKNCQIENIEKLLEIAIEMLHISMSKC